MKLRILFCLSLFLSSIHFLNAQYPIPSDTATLAVNNLIVKLINGGSFLDDRNGQIPLSAKTDNGEIPLIGAAGLWLGGLDIGGTKKAAIGLYNEEGKTDFYPGWVYSDGSLDSTVSQNFNRFWSVTAEDIGLLLADYWDNGRIDNEIPHALRAWPARGNPFFLNANGFLFPTSIIGAPFVDVNGDDRYNPLDGDYPCISGDKAYWSIFNDVGVHTYSTAEDYIQIEVESLVTAISAPGSVLDNTVFFDFSFRNRNAETIDSLYLSLAVDAILGCSSNNSVSCIPEEDIAIYYNAVPDNEFCEDSISYEQNPGIIVIKTIFPPYLSYDYSGAPMSNFMYFRKKNSVSAATDWPKTTAEYYNYIRALWRDQSPLQYGGDGFQEGTFVTKYAFAGQGNPPWYDPIINSPISIMSYHIGRLAPEKINLMMYAVTWLEGEYDVTQEADRQRIIDSMDVVYDHYTTDDGHYQHTRDICHYILPENLVSPTLPMDEFIISPNPAISEIRIQLKNSYHEIAEIQLFDIQGRKINYWTAIASRDFNIPRNGLPAGMYILIVKSSDGEEVLRKVVFE